MTSTAPGSVPRPAGNRPLSLADLADLVGPAVDGSPDAPANLRISGVTLSSAEVRPGDLYAALPGARTHGAGYAADAAARGAVAVLTDPTGRAAAAATGLPVCVVDDPRAVLGAVADRVYGEPSRRLRVLGITGTNGKTTTAYLVEAGLAAAGLGTGLIGTVQTRTRTRDADGRETVTEVPSVRTTPEAPALHALLAVDGRRRRVRGGHGGVQPRARARPGRRDPLRRRRLHQPRPRPPGLPRRPRGLLPGQGAALRRARRGRAWSPSTTRPAAGSPTGPAAPRPVTVSISGAAPTGRRPTSATGARRRVHLHAARPGRTQLAGRGCGCPAGSTSPTRSSPSRCSTPSGSPSRPRWPAWRETVVPGRMEPVDAGQPFVAVVDYAHTPDAVSTALAALRDATAGRLITVLGCGGDRDPGKRPAMGTAAASGSDVLIVTDDNPRSEDPAAIRAAMLAGVREVPDAARAEVHEVAGRREALAAAVGAGPARRHPARRGQGARDGPGDRRHRAPLRRPRRAARGPRRDGRRRHDRAEPGRGGRAGRTAS